MTFKGSNHETGIVVLVGNVNVGIVMCKIFDNIESSVKACCPKGCGVRSCLVIDISTSFNEYFNNTQVS